jgi:hypothetical protein
LALRESRCPLSGTFDRRKLSGVVDLVLALILPRPTTVDFAENTAVRSPRHDPARQSVGL